MNTDILYYICTMKEEKDFYAKTVKIPKALKNRLEKERLKIKPSPSLHAYMLFKLSK